MADKFITTQEAGEILGCTARHVSALVRRGIIDAKRFGRVLMVSRKSVTAYDKPYIRKRGRPWGAKDSRPRRKPQPKTIKFVQFEQRSSRARRAVEI